MSNYRTNCYRLCLVVGGDYLRRGVAELLSMRLVLEIDNFHFETSLLRTHYQIKLNQRREATSSEIIIIVFAFEGFIN